MTILSPRRTGRFLLAAMVILAAAAMPAAGAVVLFTSGETPTTLDGFEAPSSEVLQLKVLETANDVHAPAFCTDRQRPDNLIALGKNSLNDARVDGYADGPFQDFAEFEVLALPE